MAVGCNITAEDRLPIAVDNNNITHVDQFQYLVRQIMGKLMQKLTNL